MCRQDRCNLDSNKNVDNCDSNDATSNKVLKILLNLKNHYVSSTIVPIEHDYLYDVAHKLHTILDSSQKVAMARIITLKTTTTQVEVDSCISNNTTTTTTTTTATDMNMDNINYDDFQGEGLSYPLVNYLLKQSVEDFLSSIRANTSIASLASRSETKLLYKVLQLHLHLTRLDVTLSEEMAKSGLHVHLSKLIFLDSSSIIETMYGSKENNELEDKVNGTGTTGGIDVTKSLSRIEVIEQDEDLLTEIQDQACEMVHDSRLPHLTFPVKISPFTKEELLNRLPLEFHVQSPYFYDDSINHDNINGVNDDSNADANAISKDNLSCNLSVSKFMTFIVQQVTDRQSAQEDVGFVMWPSAVVLSSWLLANPEILYNKQILELGAGCGLTGLVASRIVSEYEQQQQQQKQMQLDKKVSTTEEEKKCDGNGGLTIKNDQGMNMKEGKKVKMTDFNSKVLTNLDRNIDLNQLNHVATTSKLDFYCQKGNNYPGGWITEQKSEFEIECGGEQPPVDLILAADVICKPSDSIAASKTIYDVLKPGGEAIIVSADAKHRFGVDIFERECKSVGLELKVINVTDLCDGKLLPQTESSDDPCGIRQTSGFVDGMSLTMFRIIKPEK